MSTSSMTAAITTAARVASGRLSNSPVRNSSVTTVSTATTIPDICDLAPAEPLTAVFERLPLTDHPGTQPSSEVRRAEAEQLAVGVDLVVLAGGVRLRRAETLGEPDEHDPGCGPRSAEVVVESDAVGRPQLGQPTGDLPDDGDPFVGQVEELDHDDPERHGHERSGDRRREATQSEDDGERRGADGECPCLGCRRGE